MCHVKLFANEMKHCIKLVIIRAAQFEYLSVFLMSAFAAIADISECYQIPLQMTGLPRQRKR